MAAFSQAVPGRIFISYRREDAAYPTGWLFDRIANKFGNDQVFKDVDSIQLGDDFFEVITARVASCDVLLAVIGERWLTITNEHGQRRLDNPEDYVRLEIETALRRNIRVIPILVDRAQMPRADQLPASLAGLVRRHALELSPNRFSSDTDRLIAVLERTIADGQGSDPRIQETIQETSTRPDLGSKPRQQIKPSAEQNSYQSDSQASLDHPMSVGKLNNQTEGARNRPTQRAGRTRYGWYTAGWSAGCGLCVAIFIYCLFVLALSVKLSGVEYVMTIVGTVVTGIGMIGSAFLAIRGRSSRLN